MAFTFGPLGTGTNSFVTFTFGPLGTGTYSFVTFTFAFTFIFVFAFTSMEAPQCIYILFHSCRIRIRIRMSHTTCKES